MPKQNLLTNLKVDKASCPSGKRYIWLSDGNGLMLRIDEAQNKFWSVRLYRDTKESIRGIGKYPTIALKEARGIRDTYKKMWANNIDPSIQKQIAKNTIISQADLTFEKAYTTTLNNKIIPHLADKTIKRTKEFYKNFLKTPLGRLPLAEVNDEILLTVLERVHKKAPSSAMKVKSLVNQVFIHMKEKRLFKGANPTLELKGNSLLAPPKRKHFSHLAEDKVGEFLTKLDMDRESGLSVRTFVYVVMITALRTGSLTNAKWSWLDTKTNTLNIPSMRMKGRVSFRCPLPKQCMAKLNALKTLLNSKGKDYIFEGLKGKPISENTARLTVQRLTGDKTTVHGFRTLFNIVVSKMGKFEIEKIEAQLTHAFTSTDIRKVYMGKEDYLDDRRKIVQAYADWCDKQ
jgi:integrase